MADFLTKCLKFDKKDRLPATQLSRHPVFNPVRQKIEALIKDVVETSTLY